MLLAFEGMKINQMIDLQLSTAVSVEPYKPHHTLLRMLESNLNVLADSRTTKDPESGSMADFALLTAKLDLYSFGLNQATKLRTSDATHLRLSAFNCATRLIQLFLAAPFIPPQVDGSIAIPILPVQAFYPRSYWRGFVYACLILLKLNLTKTLPDPETSQSEVFIQQAVKLLTACAIEGDELYRVTTLIRFLSKEARQEAISPRHEVRSRMGASLMYEMIFSVLAWRKQQAAEQRRDLMNRPEDSNPTGNISHMDSLIIPDMSPEAMDELLASSGSLIEELGPIGLDADFWPLSMSNQVCLPMIASP